MNAVEFRSALARHALTEAEFARMTGDKLRTVRQWGSGDRPVPMAVVLAFRLIEDVGLLPEDAVELAASVMESRNLTLEDIAALDLPSLREA